MERSERIALEARLGLAEFALSNTRDSLQRGRLFHLINELKIKLSHY